MKKKILLTAIITLLVVPLMVVNAASKTDSIVKGLKELVKDFDGKVTYEDNRIDIDWETTNSKSSEISYSYKDIFSMNKFFSSLNFNDKIISIKNITKE